MIIPVSIGFILGMLLFAGILGKMIFENIVVPILVIIGIVLAVWLIIKIFRKWSDDISDIQEYYEEDDDWNR